MTDGISDAYRGKCSKCGDKNVMVEYIIINGKEVSYCIPCYKEHIKNG